MDCASAITNTIAALDQGDSDDPENSISPIKVCLPERKLLISGVLDDELTS